MTLSAKFIHTFVQLITISLLIALSETAQALPSFSRQTGLACASCHIQAFGPELNSFGRNFKLHGYTYGSASGFIPPLSVQMQGSFTNTQKNDPGNADTYPGANANNNTLWNSGSLFYAGRIYGKMGAMSELQYDPSASAVALDNTDVRLVDNFNLGGQDLVLGITANNNPTVQDLWNTTPAWSWPYSTSPLAPSAVASPLIYSGFDHQAGGSSAYMMWNNTLYLEAGAYGTLSRNLQKGLGEGRSTNIQGGAPYWRAALQQSLDGHYFEFGLFGLNANTYTEPLNLSSGVNGFSDVGIDANYQSEFSTKHIFQFKSSYVQENQQLQAASQAGLSSSNHGYLDALNINSSYTLDQTYVLAFGYFDTWGSSNNLYYNTDAINTRTGSPNTAGFTTEIDYVPFGKSNSLYKPWVNLRFSVAYTAYERFNGSSNNYNADGRSAANNNTLFVNSWLAF